MARYDRVIKNGMIIDGSRLPRFRGDIGISDGLIAEIGRIEPADAEEVIDADGLIVAPGFIDIHTHSDFTLPLNPKAEAKIRQGVTTEVVGNCGFSVAPALPGKIDALRDYLSGSAPWLSFEETSFQRYMDEWPDIAVNTVMQVGHNTLRLMAMGMEDRAPNEGERRHLADAELRPIPSIWGHRAGNPRDDPPDAAYLRAAVAELLGARA